MFNFNNFIRSLALIILISLPITGLADDACETKKTPGEWDKSASLGINATRGNSDTSLFTGGIRGDLERDQNIWQLEAGFANGEKDSEKTQDMVRASVNYKRLLDERLFAGANTSFLYDDIAAVRYRVPLSTALGYFFIKNDDYKLSAEAGPGYIFEKLGDEKRDYFAPRIGQNFEWKLSSTSKFFQSSEMFFSTDDSSDYLLKAQAGVEAALTTVLALVLTADNTYDNEPAAGKDRNDFAITSALKISI